MTAEIFTHGWRAMATFFELALWGRDRLYMETVAEEAEAEVACAEQMLSRYRESSDLYEVNLRASEETVYTDPRLFHLLEHALRLSAATSGTFDVTVGPLVSAWGFFGDSGHPATLEEREAARALVGADKVLLDREVHGVRFAVHGVQLDLGAIGKGYAVDRVCSLVREREVPGCLVHGGTSSIGAVGPAPDGFPWRVEIRPPADLPAGLPIVRLEDASLSVSAPHGKGFTSEGRHLGHVIDPRTGVPTRGALLAAVAAPSATDADALSTALLVAGEAILAAVLDRPNTGALLVQSRYDGELHVLDRLGRYGP